MSNFTFAWPWLHTAFKAKYWMAPFYYRFTSDPLIVGAQVDRTIRMQGDAHTLILAWKRHAGIAPVAGVIGQTGEFTMTQAVEDRNVEEGPLSNLIYGAGINNNVLASSQLEIDHASTFPFPLSIKSGGYLRFVAVNGTLPNNIIQIVWEGVKFYPKPGVSSIPDDMGRDFFKA